MCYIDNLAGVNPIKFSELFNWNVVNSIVTFPWTRVPISKVNETSLNRRFSFLILLNKHRIWNLFHI